jgi:hypothetical protein
MQMRTYSVQGHFPAKTRAKTEIWKNVGTRIDKTVQSGAHVLEFLTASMKPLFCGIGERVIAEFETVSHLGDRCTAPFGNSISAQGRKDLFTPDVNHFLNIRSQRHTDKDL